MNVATWRTAIRTCLLIGLMFAYSQAPAEEGKPAESLLVITGDPMPQVRVGNDKHCSEMTEIDQSAMTQKDRLNVILSAGQLTWISLAGQVNDKKCESMISLVPDAGGGYIARFAKRSCLIELYQGKKGEAPVLKKWGNVLEWSKLLCAVSTDPSGEPRLSMEGAENRLLIGQDGFCGKMEDVKREARTGAALKSNVQNWVRIVFRSGRLETEFNFSFVPKPGTAYYVLREGGVVKLLRLLPDANFAPEPLTPETDRNCLFQ